MTNTVPPSDLAAQQEALRAAAAKAPELSDFGFGVFDPRSKTPEQRAAEFAENRAALFSDDAVNGFAAARCWLAAQTKTKRVNKHIGTSYGLKHTAEHDIGYVTNGQFIAAAIAEGFIVERAPNGSPNAWLNISSRLTPFPTCRKAWAEPWTEKTPETVPW